jgi:hypothetical protein
MRHLLTIVCFAISTSLYGQEPKISPTEELRITVNEWVETMQKIQQEENEWTRDQEVLTNYREGLEKEITDLKEKIADAQTRKAGSDAESLKQTQEPKVSQAIEDLERDLKLPEEKRNEGVSKRLLNLLNLTAEIEKFQQTVVLRQELRSDSNGREFNMQVIYFGLSVAYAVNEDGSFALLGMPSEKHGWKFEEKKDLADGIRNLIACTTGDQDPAFISLPISK